MRSPTAASPQERSGRWIPWVFVAFFGVVLAVNGTMIVIALNTWPGLETKDAYQRGLAYNRTLAAAAEQEALGWDVDFGFEQTGARRGLVRLELADRFGNRLQRAEVRATFVRPTQEGHDRVVDLPHQTGGRYAAEVELPFPGQWDVRVRAVERSQVYRLRERLHVKP